MSLSLPLALGAAFFAGLAFLASGKAKAVPALAPSRRERGGGVPAPVVPAPALPAQIEEKLAAIIPSRAKPSRGRVAVVKFTPRKVVWRKHKKTGKVQYRTQIKEEPAALAAQASKRLGREISLGTFALATMMASEAGRGSPLAKAAVAHAAITYTARHGGGQTLLQILLGKDGRFGGQQGRYAATSHAPLECDIELAESIAAGKVANPTPGAIQWDSPRTQNLLKAQGVPGYESNADELKKRREDKGKIAVYLPGVDREYLRLWKAKAA
jgi:hypothetical protein